MSEPQTLEDRVAYLEANIQALNKATTDTAKAIQQLISAYQAKGSDLSNTLDGVLLNVCPFPPNC